MHGIWLRQIAFTSADINYLYQLRVANNKYFFLPPPKSMEEHREWVGKYINIKGAKKFYIVYNEGAQIGTISITRKPRYKIAIIGNVIIDSNSRNQGYGSKLIDLLSKILKAEGYIYIDLEVKGSNFDAIRFYKKEGFNINRERIPMRKVI